MEKVAKIHTITKKTNLMILGALGVYLGVTLFLHWPHIEKFSRLDYLFTINTVVGCLGCFVLSRRWISSFGGSLLSGAIYGFCPFTLSFSGYHSFATLPMAAIPWLFCIAAFFRHNPLKKKSLYEFSGTMLLTLLPFGAIGFFFWLCAQPWLPLGPFFPMPKNEQFTINHFFGFVFPLSNTTSFAFAFYHVPVAMIIMGIFIYAAARRFSILLLVGLGFALAFFDTFTVVSPVAWAIVPVLFCSILAGLGMQGLAWAGKGDKKWIAITAMLTVSLAVVAMLNPNPSNVTVIANSMYWMIAAILAAIYFIAKASLRWHKLRWIMLSAALAMDVVFGATYLIDKIMP